MNIIEFPTFPTEQFDITLLDPPWLYYGDPNKPQACGKHYSCMSYEQLKCLPVSKLNSELIFIWTTCSMMYQSMNLIVDWGYYNRGIQFAWAKTNKKGEIINAQGVRPSIVKPTTEYVIAGSKKEKGRPLPLMCESIPQVILASRGRHSEKPEILQDYIDKMYPTQTKVEIFARRVRPGWTCWGNEV
jgi:N6-adenosine-specific RNA methylase IME4